MIPSNALTAEEIIGLPKPVLPKIDHVPTFEDIQVTNPLLNVNSIKVPSMAGGGGHGHLGVIMTQVVYDAISAASWAEPFNPCAIPIIPAGTNTFDAAQIACIHDEFCCIRTNVIKVDQALKCIMLEVHYTVYLFRLYSLIMRIQI
jgi:hypothetical protein